jgi:hypothetical protein
MRRLIAKDRANIGRDGELYVEIMRPPPAEGAIRAAIGRIGALQTQAVGETAGAGREIRRRCQRQAAGAQIDVKAGRPGLIGLIDRFPIQVLSDKREPVSDFDEQP